MRDSEPGWQKKDDYFLSWEFQNIRANREISPHDMTAEFVVEHSLDMIGSGDSFEFRVGALADVEHFYPGASVDEFGVMSVGWPTDAELETNRRPGGKRRRWFRR